MVIVYSKNDCMQCKMTKKYLNDRGIEFQEENTSEKPELIPKIKHMGYSGLPVVVTSETDWHGFRPDMLAKIK